MRFENLSYLLLLWIIPALIIFYIYVFTRKSKLISQFCSDKILSKLIPDISKTKQRLKATLLIISVFFIVLSLSRPQWGFQWEDIKREGVDILIALDVSESMLAEDIKPNRLERAKRKIRDLLKLLDGDRIGLIAFAGTSFLECPLTLDYGAVEIFLDYLDTELIPLKGTAIGHAIDTAIESFESKDKKSKSLILITDGEDHEGNPIEMAKRAHKEGIKIFTIGVGSSEGAPIPTKDGSGGFKKDNQGNLVLSKPDEEILRKIALETGGFYVRSVSNDLDLETIYKEGIKKMEKKELQSSRRKRWEERFQWFLGIAIFLIVIEVIISERKKFIDVRI